MEKRVSFPGEMESTVHLVRMSLQADKDAGGLSMYLRESDCEITASATRMVSAVVHMDRWI